MKHHYLLSILLLLGITTFGQLIIDKGIYKANFSNTFRAPRYVSYMLHKGGGDCDRLAEGFDFKNDPECPECATHNDYKNNGVYVKGHLANAEDFAFNCKKEELTFRYYNCLPQTTNLNVSAWKKNETEVRKWSQKEKLYIVCGGYFSSKKMRRVTVPTYCWKVVQSVRTKKVLFCGWFTNTSNSTVEEISVTELGRRLHSRIILLK